MDLPTPWCSAQDTGRQTWQLTREVLSWCWERQEGRMRPAQGMCTGRTIHDRRSLLLPTVSSIPIVHCGQLRAQYHPVHPSMSSISASSGRESISDSDSGRKGIRGHCGISADLYVYGKEDGYTRWCDDHLPKRSAVVTGRAGSRESSVAHARRLPLLKTNDCSRSASATGWQVPKDPQLIRSLWDPQPQSRLLCRQRSVPPEDRCKRRY